MNIHDLHAASSRFASQALSGVYYYLNGQFVVLWATWCLVGNKQECAY